MKDIKRHISVSKIETYLYSLIYNKVSKHVYPDTLPDTTDSSWNDMVLIDCGRTTNYDAYGRGFVDICLYARPKGDGSKNVPLLSRMEDKLLTEVENAVDEHYDIVYNATYPYYDTNRNWHYNVVELLVKIH